MRLSDHSTFYNELASYGRGGEARTDGPGILHLRRPTRAKPASEALLSSMKHLLQPDDTS